MKRCLVFILVLITLLLKLNGQPTFGTDSFISFDKGVLTISAEGKSAPLLVSSKEWPGVIRAFKDLQHDIEKVSSILPQLYTDQIPGSKEIIIAGTIGKSPIIDELIKQKKLKVGDITGRWEAFSVQVVKKPVKGVKRALVIAGSDKRGTIYGIYEMSRQIGVSPWYWWADVHISHKDALYALPERYVQNSPSVKYRGIFLNDEAPDLTNWIRGKFGDVPTSDNPPMPGGVANYGREFYTRLFELMLRLKGNYLWPAMWNNAFNEDDPENPRLADEYGIVMGNSHQEPMLRAQKEWDRRYQKSIGSWNYAKNPDIVEAFWREGIRRNKDYESIVTIGLRGANDTPMAPGGPEANMALLEKIVEVQRNILTKEMNSDITRIPQLWCLYKEVQEYYAAGMRVPEDVTLLWAEDNWGNVRRLPTAEERNRSGGAGIYYHFDYHGGPRSYQWINTNPVSKVWDQMSLAKQYGADRIWIVNVGHFKGYEFPIEYFLDLAWNTDKLTNDNIREYTEYWAAREFGPEYAKETAEIMSLYTKYNSRRKPELLSPSTYSLINYREAERVVKDYNTLSYKATSVSGRLPDEKKNSFYQLVLFPVMASAIVNELYFSAGKNLLYSKQGRASTNNLADYVQILFQNDTSLMGYFNRDFAGGKWNHFMDQSHLGYTSWADPPVNSLRALSLKRNDQPEEPSLGVMVEGSETVWPGGEGSPALPVFDIFNNQEFYIEAFNKGRRPFEIKAISEEPWVKIRREKVPIGGDDRLWVSVDWSKADKIRNEGSIKISGAGSELTVLLTAFKPGTPTRESLDGFAEGNGYVSMEAEHFYVNRNAGDRHWSRIEDYGHTLSGMRAEAPVDALPATPGKDSPSLEYKMYIFNPGNLEVTSVFSPTLNFMPGRDLRYAISFDDQQPVITTLVPGDYNAQNRNADWEKSVSDNARFSITKHNITSPGYHTVKIWMIDPGPVLQKIIVNTGGLRPSYLGPPESYNNRIASNK
jgi:hypothetical protein